MANDKNKILNLEHIYLAFLLFFAFVRGNQTLTQQIYNNMFKMCDFTRMTHPI